MPDRLLFKTPRGEGVPAVPRHPDFLGPLPPGGGGVPRRAGTKRVFLWVCIKTGQKFYGCAGHMGLFWTPGGPGGAQAPPLGGGPKIKKKPDVRGWKGDDTTGVGNF